MPDRAPEREQRWILRGHTTGPPGPMQGNVVYVEAGPAIAPHTEVEVVPANHPALLTDDEARLLGGYEDTMTVAELEAKNAIRKRLREYAGEQMENQP